MADTAIHEDDRVSELALSIAWHGGLTREVTTLDGQRLAVVFPGHWTHGHGPDFRGAMLEGAGGRLIAGSVELHHRASDWQRHGHDADPAYNDVVLHIVTTVDCTETRRLDGSLVPTARLRVPEAQLRAVEQRNPSVWSRFGGDVCAPRLAMEQPGRIRAILDALGDLRFDERVTRFEADLATAPPASVLAPALFEAFGYARNREQMRLLAERVDWPSLAPRLVRQTTGVRVETTLAILLGVGGWMPVSPAHASLAGFSPASVAALETRWAGEADAWRHAILPSTIWDLARVRPANHPVARVATLAALLGAHGHDLVPVLSDVVRSEVPIEERLQRLVSRPETPPLGRDRAIAIAASVVAPFLTALARASGDDGLEDAALAAWARLPAASTSQPARRARQQVAGETRIRGLKERGNQGLLLLDKRYCGPRRCYECPIARAVVADELARGSKGEPNP
ncbi:MAG TPA: DUF2851 family protein [Candidatus Limnocylindrales bacterium]|nr:DUF2851 family protein [Candidatus Limnocylindrales bacterium]